MLGSCIAVAMFDPIRKIGGMNHFMLPFTINEECFYLSKSGKYGMYAMELLINELLKLGAARSVIKAKVFGGGNVLQNVKDFSGSVPENNIKFALEYLNAEGIPIVAQDVGGTEARRVFFFTDTAKIRLKRISRTLVQPLESDELEYLQKIRREKAAAGKVTLF
ncbi:Chemoreceptor glutamine deamidase CheD [subsurface metagenome]